MLTKSISISLPVASSTLSDIAGIGTSRQRELLRYFRRILLKVPGMGPKAPRRCGPTSTPTGELAPPITESTAAPAGSEADAEAEAYAVESAFAEETSEDGAEDGGGDGEENDDSTGDVVEEVS